MLITISGIFRNNQSYIQWLTNTLTNIEQLYQNEHRFEYCFYENDSTDQTQTLLNSFMKTRNGIFTSEQHPKSHIKPMIGRGNEKSRTTDRTHSLAEYRNMCFAKSKPLKSEWTLIIDSDIYFDEHIIANFVEHVEKYSNDGFVMYTANTVDSSGLYFDTWAYKDTRNVYLTREYLIQKYGKDGARIHSDIAVDRQCWNDGKPISVNSAFGGCAFIESVILNECSWSAPIGCEHWEFCRMVRECNGGKGKIGVCPTIKCVNRESPSNVKRKMTKQMLKEQICKSKTKRQKAKQITSKK